ncbi:hypothetical protein [Hymenobacter coccineus]|uniref:Uncharacterized protein n=1 Tax=Hymenobacter coccineus TaxID=1908235 RepID=A0A1G1TMU0_9BACT|nr:hypothetical protein [Hymenobacter coccineus]OGX92199.1 hypothetical protein BEN49_16810 [Hymenobacter coccineus]
MSHRRDLKLLRRAQKQAKRQLRQLAALELTGLTAVTLHAHTRQVTVVLASATGAPFTDALREALHARRQALQAEAQQLLRTWLEDAQLRDRPAPAAGSSRP